MTHQVQAVAHDRIAEFLAEHGFHGHAQAIVVILNEIMKIKRSHALGAAPCHWTEGRTGYPNGYMPRTAHIRPGPLNVEVPQPRGVEF